MRRPAVGAARGRMRALGTGPQGRFARNGSSKKSRQNGLAEWALEDLVDIGVGERLQRCGPFARDLASRRLRPNPPIPADLLHVVIELDAVTVRIEREGRIVDARVELGRDRVDKGDAARFEERDSRAQLGIAAELDAERHAGRALTEAEPMPQFLWEEPQ